MPCPRVTPFPLKKETPNHYHGGWEFMFYMKVFIFLEQLEAWP